MAWPESFAGDGLRLLTLSAEDGHAPASDPNPSYAAGKICISVRYVVIYEAESYTAGKVFI